MTIEEYNKNKRKRSNNKYIKSFISRFMISTIILLTLLILISKSEKIHNFVKNTVYSKQFNFSSVNKFYNKYILNPISNSKGSIMVFKDNNKEEMIEYNGGVKINKSNDKNVKVVESGIVVFIGEKEGFGNTIIIQQSNGIDCWYGNVNNINTNIYSYVTKNTIIGNTNDYLYLYFEKDGKTVDYKDFI